MKRGEYRWRQLWERSAAWGSVPSTEDWKKPYRMLGLVELVTKPKRRAPPPPLRFNCHVEHETEKAWLVEIDGHETWLPKSRCRLSDDGHSIEVESWLWKQKLIEREELQQ